MAPIRSGRTGGGRKAETKVVHIDKARTMNNIKWAALLGRQSPPSPVPRTNLNE